MSAKNADTILRDLFNVMETPRSRKATQAWDAARIYLKAQQTTEERVNAKVCSLAHALRGLKVGK